MKISTILLTLCGSLIPASLGMTWEEADVKARELVNDLTNEEKISLTTGSGRFLSTCAGVLTAIPRKNIEQICLHDGPSGVGAAKGTSTSWEVSINNGATFNKKLLYEIGVSQGEEFRKKGVHVALTPTMNLMRAPTGGRIWEGFGEDPYHSGICATEIIKGIQSQGVVATAKHFIANEQEFDRATSSSNMDNQTLMEIYVEPFYMSINDGEVGAIMTSYNALNNVYCLKNKPLLSGLLKDKLGFKGFTMSDWLTVKDLDSFRAGLDMNMPGCDNFGSPTSYWGSNIEDGIKAGNIEQSRLDDAALRTVRAFYKVGLMDLMENKEFPPLNLLEPIRHLDLQKRAAIESHVLLKNDKILPLTKNVQSIAVIGSDASKPIVCPEGEVCLNGLGIASTVIRNGTVIHGWGSAATDIPDDVSVPVDEIVKRAEKNSITVYKSATDDLEAGVKAAKDAEIAIVFVRANSGEDLHEKEGHDRLNLDLWSNGNDLVKAVAAVNKKVIVVIHAPGPVNLPFMKSVKAIVHAGMPGHSAGIAITEILFGDANPSGHLPYTWGSIDDYCCKTITSSDLQNTVDGLTQYNYDEGLFVGYRWFDKYGKIPTFPYGFGLSYTSFKYSGLSVSFLNKNGKINGLIATFKVKNTGKVEGAAVPMLFLSLPDVKETKDYPSHILKGFEKVNLKPNKSEMVTIKLNKHQLSYYNNEKDEFVIPVGGYYKVYIGENANKVVLSKKIKNSQKKDDDDEDSE